MLNFVAKYMQSQVFLCIKLRIILNNLRQSIELNLNCDFNCPKKHGK